MRTRVVYQDIDGTEFRPDPVDQVRKAFSVIDVIRDVPAVAAQFGGGLLQHRFSSANENKTRPGVA